MDRCRLGCIAQEITHQMNSITGNQGTHAADIGASCPCCKHRQQAPGMLGVRMTACCHMLDVRQWCRAGLNSESLSFNEGWRVWRAENTWPRLVLLKHFIQLSRSSRSLARACCGLVLPTHQASSCEAHAISRHSLQISVQQFVATLDDELGWLQVRKNTFQLKFLRC